MTIDFEYLDVPKGDKAVYGLAEAYFIRGLTAHFRAMDYDCYQEYEYGGGSTFMPTSPTGSHTNQWKALILRMLQGEDDGLGFRFPKPKVIRGKLKERGFQKPDFLAFRAYDGVVAEIGTARMRAEKMSQLNGRLHDLNALAEEEKTVQIQKSIGEPVRWHGMIWRAAPYHPKEGPVLIPVDEDRLISTLPTFEPKTNGIYLYQLLRYQRHRLPISRPVAFPRLAPMMEEQLKEAWRRYQQPGGAKTAPQGSNTDPRQPGWLDGWPALRKDLSAMVTRVGIVVVVAAVVAFVVAAFSLVTAGAAVAIAGFAAVLVSALGGTSGANPGIPLI